MIYDMHFNIYIFPMILLTIIWFTIQKKRIRTAEDRLFQTLLMINALALLTDIFGWNLNGTGAIGTNRVLWILNVIYLMVNGMISVAWLEYMFFISHRKNSYQMSIMRKISVWAPCLVNYLLILSSCVTGWIFTIDAQNFYQRGPYFYIPYLATGYYIMYSVLTLLRETRREPLLSQKKEYRKLTLITLIPVAGMLSQMIFYGTWLVLPMSAMALLMVYINMQNYQITSDALTGLNNRGYFDRFLREQVNREDSWYLFIIDMDHFKQINDTHGHTTGDKALREMSWILKNTFGKTRAFLARYGGDEFAVIRSCDNDEEAGEVVKLLKENTEKFNEQYSNPYRLSISVGFAKYGASYESHLEELITKADEMMYRDKEGKRR